MGDTGFSALPSGDPAGPLHTEREIRYRPHTARVYARGKAPGATGQGPAQEQTR